MKYFKKPYPIDAVQWFKFGDQPTQSFVTGGPHGYSLQTREGYQPLTAGCWIVGPGVEDEYWVVQESIFTKTYTSYE